MTDHFTYRQEVYRKLIHLSSLWMACAVLFLPQSVCLTLFGLGTCAVLFFEFIRTKNHPLGHFAIKIFGKLLRPQETNAGFKPSGAVYVLLSAFIITFISPKEIAALALIIALTSDTAAALIGRKWGKTPFYGKSCEGTAAFIIIGTLAGYVSGLLIGIEIDYLLCAVIAATIIAALAEVFSPKIFLDDNFSVPIAAALTLLWLF